MPLLSRGKWLLNSLDNGLKYVKQIGLSICPEFVIDQDNKQVILSLIQYFNGYQEYSPGSGMAGDLTKGILLLGEPGTGKTLLMRIFSEYVTVDKIFFIAEGKQVSMCYIIKPVIEVVSEFEIHGHDTVNVYSKRRIICFDDLGEEKKEALFFGSRNNVMQQIFERRYHNPVLTIATTNYSLDKLGEMYGARVLSRMYEMFNIMVITGPDRRIEAIKFA